jgi:uncharacterized protein
MKASLFLSPRTIIDRREFFPLVSGFGLFLLGAEIALPSSFIKTDPLEGREEKLKVLRDKRDRFFREDLHSPLKEMDRKDFKGLHYYPIDLRYAMVVLIEKYPAGANPLYVTLPTNKEKGRKYIKYGRFRFNDDGKSHSLHIYRPLGGGELFLPFKDRTSGQETYSMGRYLYIEPMPGEKVLIDFNRAYNPFCAYNERYTCPFAPEENRLEIAIRAGEKRLR